MEYKIDVLNFNLQEFEKTLAFALELGYKFGLDGKVMVDTMMQFAIDKAEAEGDDIISRMFGHGD